MKFHAINNDYFGTLATVLDLMRQDITYEGFKEKHNKLLKRKRDELVYMQNHYKIIRK